MYEYIPAIKFFFELLLTLCHSAMLNHERNDFICFALGKQNEIVSYWSWSKRKLKACAVLTKLLRRYQNYQNGAVSNQLGDIGRGGGQWVGGDSEYVDMWQRVQRSTGLFINLSPHKMGVKQIRHNLFFSLFLSDPVPSWTLLSVSRLFS
jgi:hypothetical protein